MTLHDVMIVTCASIFAKSTVSVMCMSLDAVSLASKGAFVPKAVAYAATLICSKATEAVVSCQLSLPEPV